MYASLDWILKLLLSTTPVNFQSFAVKKRDLWNIILVTVTDVTNLAAVGDGSSNSIGQCQTDTFSVSAPGSRGYLYAIILIF